MSGSPAEPKGHPQSRSPINRRGTLHRPTKVPQEGSLLATVVSIILTLFDVSTLSYSAARHCKHQQHRVVRSWNNILQQEQYITARTDKKSTTMENLLKSFTPPPLNRKGEGNNMEHLVSKVLFPVFCVAHTVMWHTCKSHENDGSCVQLFGLFWDGNHHPEADAPQKPTWELWTSSNQHEQVEQEMMERQQHYRLELVREVNLALAVLCALSIFVKSETIRTQMLFVESVVFGLAAYDAFQMTVGADMTLPMVLLFLLAFLGLVIQVRKDPAIAEETLGDKQAGSTVETTREPFEKLPSEVEELLIQSAEEVASVPVFPDESSVTATVVKPNKDSVLGISVKKIADDWRIVIQKLSPNGLLGDSPLKVGQTILSVNGTPASELASARDVTSIIKEASEVTIVATDSIRIRVVKPTKDSRVGISFSKSKKQDGSLIIHKINDDSIFKGTPLQEGMRVVAINNQPCPSSLKKAGQIAKETDGALVLFAVKDDDAARSLSSPLPTSASTMVTKKVASKLEPVAESAPPLPVKEVSVKLTKSEF